MKARAVQGGLFRAAKVEGEHQGPTRSAKSLAALKGIKGFRPKSRACLRGDVKDPYNFKIGVQMLEDEVVCAGSNVTFIAKLLDDMRAMNHGVSAHNNFVFDPLALRILPADAAVDAFCDTGTHYTSVSSTK